EPSGPSRGLQILPLAARTVSALERSAERLAKHLEEEQDAAGLADTAYTLAVGRKAFSERLAVICRSRVDARGALGSEDGPGLVVRGSAAGERRQVAMLLSGQGSQYVGMGRELYETEAVFREEVDRGAEFLKPLLGLDLR